MSTQTISTPPVVKSSRAYNSLYSRYRDSYRVAKTIIGIGTAEKVLALIVGGFTVLYSFLSMSEQPRSGASVFWGQQSSTGFFLLVIGIGIVVGVAGFLHGIGTCAKGEMMLTSIDSAVNSSPLLTDDEKGNIIGVI